MKFENKKSKWRKYGRLYGATYVYYVFSEITGCTELILACNLILKSSNKMKMLTTIQGRAKWGRMNMRQSETVFLLSPYMEYIENIGFTPKILNFFCSNHVFCR
jgi:hypothetical protein